MMRRVELLEREVLRSSDKLAQKVQSEELRLLDDNIKRYLETQRRLQELSKGGK